MDVLKAPLTLNNFMEQKMDWKLALSENETKFIVQFEVDRSDIKLSSKRNQHLGIRFLTEMMLCDPNVFNCNDSQDRWDMVHHFSRTSICVLKNGTPVPEGALYALDNDEAWEESKSYLMIAILKSFLKYMKKNSSLHNLEL